jgi:hypothetical protein
MTPELEILHFQLSEQSIRNSVADATLFIHLPKTHGKVKLLVYQVMGNASEHESMTVLLTTASKPDEHREDGWIELDVKKILQDWFKHPKTNLGVIVKVEDESGASKPHRVGTYSSNGDVLVSAKLFFTLSLNLYRSITCQFAL